MAQSGALPISEGIYSATYNLRSQERRWLRLAHSYQFARKLKSFHKPDL